MQNEIKQTEWNFKKDMQENTIKLFTAPYITAKIQYSLNKYFEPALEKQVLSNLSDADFRNMMKSQGIDFNSAGLKAADMIGFKDAMLTTMRNQPLEELTKLDFNKAVEFCLLCLDKQRILNEENGINNLKFIQNKENWEIQDVELVQGILNQYTFRTDGTAMLSGDSVEAV